MSIYKSSQELEQAGQYLLDLVEKQERGEISEQELLKQWKIFSRGANRYLTTLKEKAQKKEN